MSALRYDAVLLDLDGTLADTAPDMGAALNTLLEEQALQPLPFEDIRPVVSHGAKGLLRLGFGAALTDGREAELRPRFLSLYERGLCNGTCLFPGIDQVLARLESWNVRWGVVTNKPAYLTEPPARATSRCAGVPRAWSAAIRWPRRSRTPGRSTMPPPR